MLLICNIIVSLFSLKIKIKIQNKAMHQSVKPSILSTFGDIAMAIGPLYIKYLQDVIYILKQASEASVDKVLLDLNYFTLC